MHGRIKSDMLIVDEASMIHFGEIILAATKCGAKFVFLFGDHKQVSFINRTTKLCLLCFKQIQHMRTRKYLEVFLEQQYMHSLINFSNISRECRIEHIAYNQGIVGNGKTYAIRQ